MRPRLPPFRLALLALCALALVLQLRNAQTLLPLGAASRPPPPPPPAPSAAAVLRRALAAARLPPPRCTLCLVFGTASVEHFVRNWLAHARRVPLLPPHAVLALDVALARRCEEWRAAAMDAAALLASDEAANGALRAPTRGGDVRNEREAFKRLGFLKARLALLFVSHGVSLLLSDADSVWLADPSPWVGGARAAADAGLLPTADILVTNDYPDPTRDGQPDSVFNTGALYLRASRRTAAFVAEWARRTAATAEIGNDQTELNRLLRSRYDDGAACNHPRCLLADLRLFVPTAAVFEGAGCGEAAPALEAMRAAAAAEGEPPPPAAPACGCAWVAAANESDAHTGLAAVPLRAAHAAWRRCEAHHARAGRRAAAAARGVYWMWGGRVRVGVLPMERFLGGHGYFVGRLHEQLAVRAVHVHATYTMGDGWAKEWRLRGAGLWDEPARAPPDGGLVRVGGVEELLLRLIDRMALPPRVWACEAPGEVRGGTRPASLPDLPSRFFGGARAACFHPKHLAPLSREANFTAATDPAAPHLAVQRLLRALLRNAFALAYALRRTLVLPRMWALCERHWWQLRDCRMPGVEWSLPMPFDAPLDHALDVTPRGLAGLTRVPFVAAAFLDQPHAAPLRADEETLGVGGGARHANHSLPPAATFDAAGRHLRAAWRARRHTPRLLQAAAGEGRRGGEAVDAASLLRFSRCGFDNATAAADFDHTVLRRIFAGQYSFCSEERNPFISAIILEAHAANVPEETLLLTRRNCTGQPANAFNKPKVDLGADALAFLPVDNCASESSNVGERADYVEEALAAALALVGLPFKDRAR
ncbi:hypothetical protein AB1Y20_006668 [Prymnesium parvum]|uniref:Nucleotide-diphospho-sugar transferase domain-containing protein n=1 Tax=Prymnesium parvum TaxID=97485 RepID=A0AB34IYQ7_PRYPA